MNGREKLHEQHEAMGHALQAFDDPLVDEHPGLRLMKKALTDHRAHIAAELDEAEHVQLTISVEGPPGGALTLDLAAPLLAALQEAVREVAVARADATAGLDSEQAPDAATLHVRRWEGDAITVTGPQQPLPARVADPDSGITLVEVALSDLLDALEQGDRPEVARLAELLAEHPVAVTFRLSPIVGGHRELRLVRGDVTRLRASLS